MNTQEARDLGNRISALVASGRTLQAYTLLAPVLAERTPFRLLDLIGEAAGVAPQAQVNAFLERIAADRTEGGWVVIASTLGQQTTHDREGAFARCREYIIAADVWYAADILGERVPGPVLVADFWPSLALLVPWRVDANRWVRRTLGVAVHFWAKRSRGAAELASEAGTLLSFLEPLFEERNTDAVKGVGWGLKTLGRYYPALTADWLAVQLARHGRRPKALMLRKAMTYLSDESRTSAAGGGA